MSMSIGERILTLRKTKAISQGDLAKQLGVSRQAVSKWENDQSSPDTLNLIKLADLLETEVSYLATGRSEIKPPPPIVINAVSKWENDQSSPDTLNLIKLADLLETEVSYLATGRSEIKPPPPIVINLLSKVEHVPPPPVRSSPAVRRTPPPIRWNPRFLLLLGGGCFLVGVLLGALLF